MKRWIVLLLVVLFIVPCAQESAAFWWKKKKKKGEVAQNSTPPKTLSPYELLFEGKKHVTASSDFMKVHKIDNQLYFEIPLKYMGREMLLASTVGASSNNVLGTVGFKPLDPMHIRFVMKDSAVYMRKVNVETTYDDRVRDELKRALNPEYVDLIYDKYPVKAYNQDSSAVVFEMTQLFVGNTPELCPIAKGLGYMPVGTNLKANLSSLGEIKAFNDNVSIASDMSYECSLQASSGSMPMGGVLVKAIRTLLLLPEEKMRPRVSDSRVGIFLTEKQHLVCGDPFKNYSVAHRWRVEPRDVEAYKRGELVEPVKPIVYYMDDAFPAGWKASVKEGVLRWNKAFEKIGFKNVIQVRDFPQDDPEFDPDNLKYSCIRYVPVAVENAMGPSWVDPSTGEIINASVLIYNDLIKLINIWRFVQTAQVDPRVRGKKLSDEVMKESIAYAVAHEVGHTLGLMHNMAASAAYPVDSLRSASFTRKYGTTPSIMDYARFNYVAQPGDAGVKLTPPDLGVYDEFAIKYLYQPVPDAKSLEEETTIVEGWVDEKAGDPCFRYGKQQLVGRFDPSAIEEDLGDDPIKAGEYGIKNLKYILSHLNEWIQDDPSGEYRTLLYNNIAMQYYRYLNNVEMNLGGIYLTEVKDGTAGVWKKPVPKSVQRASLKWLFKQYRSSDWLQEPQVIDKLPLALPMSANMGAAIAELHRGWAAERIDLGEHLFKNVYTQVEFFNDYYNEIWSDVIQNREPTMEDRLLHKFYINGASGLTWTQGFSGAGLVGNRDDVMTSNIAFIPSVREIHLYGLDPSGMTARYFNELRNLESRYGPAFLAKQFALTGFGAGYGWQDMINIDLINQKPSNLVKMAIKAITLLKGKLSGVSGETNAYYRMRIMQLEQILNQIKL